jgi:hypothetical protein
MALVQRIVKRQITNDTKIKQVYFDASNNTIVLEPGKSAVISALKIEEVPSMNATMSEVERLRSENKKLMEENVALKTVKPPVVFETQEKSKAKRR